MSRRWYLYSMKLNFPKRKKVIHANAIDQPGQLKLRILKMGPLLQIFKGLRSTGFQALLSVGRTYKIESPTNKNFQDYRRNRLGFPLQNPEIDSIPSNSRNLSSLSFPFFKIIMASITIPLIVGCDGAQKYQSTCMVLFTQKYLQEGNHAPNGERTGTRSCWFGIEGDVCTWRGVQCDTNGLITSIHWGRDQKALVYPGELDFRWIPSTVADINTSGRPSTGLLPTRMLPRDLRIAEFQNNRFFGTLGIAFLPPQLQVLDVRGNNFSGSLVIEQLPYGLEVLRLRGNSFVSVSWQETHNRTVKIDILERKEEPRAGQGEGGMRGPHAGIHFKAESVDKERKDEAAAGEGSAGEESPSRKVEQKWVPGRKR